MTSEPSHTPVDIPPQTQPNTTENTTDNASQKKNIPIRTHHCRFCNHLLLATTRSLSSLPRRKDPARDAAIILPLPRTTTGDDVVDEENGGAKGIKHYSILLSTSVPDRKATLVRREDGFEKRLFLRCGRCRVVVGYYLDRVHFPEDKKDNEDGNETKVVYLLPGALMETGIMGDEQKTKLMDQEWSGWASLQ